MTTISHFEGLADPADRRTLQPYREQIHAWVYITSYGLNLGEVANAFYHNNLEIVEHWTDGDGIRFDKELETDPGDNSIVVLIHPIYIMNPFRLVK